MTDRPRDVGRLIADALAAAGVELAFTVPGESFLPLLEALPEAGIRVVATRHEGGAAFMAEAAGKLSGRPAAVLGTRAVGASNMAIGIHTARQDSTPLVALVGQVERAHRGREAFQEAEIAQTIGGLAKWAAELTDADSAADVVGEGLRAMLTGRPGPIVLSLPEDVLAEEAPGATPDVRPRPADAPDEATVTRVLEFVAAGRRPLIIAGGGVLRAGATDRVVALAERLELPVMTAWRRGDAFPNDHRLYLGMTGFGAPSSVLPRVLAADRLLVLGCRLNEVASFAYRVPADGARWAHVDLEPLGAARRRIAPDFAIASDVGDFLDVALAAPGRAAGSATSESASDNAADRQTYLAASVVDDGARWDGPGVHPGRVVTTLQRLLRPDSILTTDAGNFGLWPARGYRFLRPGTFLGPTSGAMGYGLPAAIAAALCRPDRQVVALCGDGGFAMTMNELETAVREGVAPVSLVFDNRRYGTIAMHQRREGRQPVATELGPIEFAAVAQACGAAGVRVERDSDFEPALRDALQAGRPQVLHLELDARWVSPDVFADG